MSSSQTSTPSIEKQHFAPSVTASFRKPGSPDWNELHASSQSGQTKPDESANKVEAAKETLKNMLMQSLQMQHLVVLAGSGCSLYAGGPSMGALWNAVIGKPASKEATAVSQAVGSNLQEDKMQNVEDFLSRIQALLAVKEDAITKGNEPIKIADFLKDAQKTILDKCKSFLSFKNLSAHETLLHRLSRRRTRDQRLRIFTTNYDLCFEHAAANIGCVAIDGFSFMAPRQYDPRYFVFDIIRRPRIGDDSGNYLEGVFLLYKLHGSVNWEKEGHAIVQKDEPASENACLIYPARGKYQQSYNQPFIESISQYLVAVREPNTCLIVVGFGFNDNHLSEPILSAVRSNPHLRLIIVDSNAKANADRGEALENQYLRELFNLSDQGEDVWFVNEGFEDFAKRIPDLKSLTPAERLLKNIKGVVNSHE